MATVQIKDVSGLEILDSRGNPTVRVRVTLNNGVSEYASVPSGASTGSHEACELRDGNKERYGGKGVTKAVKNVNTVLRKAVLGLDPTKQRQIDQIMIKLDGTPNKSRLGANAILGVSLAVARAAAVSKRQPLYRYLRTAFRLPYKTWRLPTPTFNLINGGAHAAWSLDIQEFMIIPQQKSLSAKVRCAAEVFQVLGSILKSQDLTTLKGDEGGYAPRLAGNEQALQVLSQAVAQAGYRPGTDVLFGLDMAATEFYDAQAQRYVLKADKKLLTAEELINLEASWAERYPLASIEDGLAEDDWSHWALLTKRLGRRVTLVGDDLFVTSTERLQRGIDEKVGNAILIKCNQIGTLSETIDAIELAHKNGYKTSISHRSGETADTTIADLAVAVNAAYIKTGSLARSERVEKYNRLLEIEAELH